MLSLSASPTPWPRSSFLLTAVLVWGVAAVPRSAARDWPQYRGPAVSGISAENDIFDRSQTGLAVAWQAEIGSGYSGIVVAGTRAVTMYAEDELDFVAAFDTESGEKLWTYAIDKTYVGHDGSHDGPIATPVAASGRVYGVGPWGRLFALDVASGAEIWATHLSDDHGIAKPMYGFGSSPILEDGVLVVALGGEGTALGGFDPATGAKRWVAGSDLIFYQTPVPTTLGGRRQVVAAGLQNLFGLDARSGEVLWQWAHGGDGSRGAFSLVPVPLPGGRFFLSHQDDASVLIETGADGTVDELWQGRAIRNSYNTPVFHDGHLYAYSSRFLTCVEAQTGEARWRSREPGDGFLILVDGRLVIVTKKGGVHLVEASPEGFREIAGLPVFDDSSWTLPSFADGHIYARSLGEIARIDLEASAVAGASEASASRSRSAFGRFLSELEGADPQRRGAMIDRFLARQESFPILEGSNRVHFVYRGSGEDLALAGDMFGGRVERAMTRVPGTDLFYHSLELESDARLNYVFLRDFEAILDPRNPRSVPVSYFTSDIEIDFLGEGMAMSWLAMPEWRRPAHVEEAPEPDRGRIETRRFKSAVMGEEVPLHVYLPKGYGEKDARRYPVAYVFRGDEAIDHGQVPNSLDNLIGASVEPLIVVFMEGRSPDMLSIVPWFLRFDEALASEIVPWVDASYRTLARPESRATVGAAFPAFYAAASAFRHPDLFGKLGMQSLFLTEAFLPLLDSPSAGECRLRIYLDWGRYDLRSAHEPIDMSVMIPEKLAELREMGCDVVGGPVSDGIGWSSWRLRTDRLYGTLFPLRSDR